MLANDRRLETDIARVREDVGGLDALEGGDWGAARIQFTCLYWYKRTNSDAAHLLRQGNSRTRAQLLSNNRLYVLYWHKSTNTDAAHLLRALHQIRETLGRARGSRATAGFTCFIGTKVQILTLRTCCVHCVRQPVGRARGSRAKAGY